MLALDRLPHARFENLVGAVVLVVANGAVVFDGQQHWQDPMSTEKIIFLQALEAAVPKTAFIHLVRNIQERLPQVLCVVAIAIRDRCREVAADETVPLIEFLLLAPNYGVSFSLLLLL